MLSFILGYLVIGLLVALALPFISKDCAEKCKVNPVDWFLNTIATWIIMLFSHISENYNFRFKWFNKLVESHWNRGGDGDATVHFIAEDDAVFTEDLKKYVENCNSRDLSRIKFVTEKGDCKSYKLDMHLDNSYINDDFPLVLIEASSKIEMILSYYEGKDIYIYDVMFIPAFGATSGVKIRYYIK